MVERKRFTITEYRQKTGAKASRELLQLRRTQLEINSKITKSLAARPKTIPEVANDTGYQARMVLWYVMTYYNYSLITIAGKTDEGYYRYALKEMR